MYGSYQRMLKIDLTSKKFTIEELSGHIFGGKILASHLLYNLNPQLVDPLSKENHIIITTGPLCQSPIWGSSRYGVYTKSPQTGFYSESYSGGKTPEAIDATGFDATIICGKAEKPTVIVIHPDGAEFYNGEKFWGLSTYETEDFVLDEFGKKSSTEEKTGAVVIGPAGENLVLFAVIENDHWRCAGRTGVGAVLGSKNIKAIVFRGNKKRSLYNPSKIKEFSKAMAIEAKESLSAKAYKSFGTPMMVDIINEIGAFPTKYWSMGRCDNREKINAHALHNGFKVKPHACPKCFMACGRLTEVTYGQRKGIKLIGPEYETIFAFGGLCMVKDMEEIIYLNDICDKLGLDTISAGNICAFTIEAAKLGKVDFSISYGDTEKIAELLHNIAYKKDIGEVLARGIKYASKKWGLEDLAVHVKGLEPAGYDPRILKGMALGYATSPRGACHLRSTFYKAELSGMIPPDEIKGKAELFVDFEDRLIIFDSLILCRFYRDLYPWEVLEEIIEITTGKNLNRDTLKKISKETITSIRRFNIREGLTYSHDMLPKAFFKPLKDSGKKITKEEFETMLKDYYRLRGWDEKGVPQN